MTQTLPVHLHGRHIGNLGIEGGGFPEDWRFTYDPDRVLVEDAAPLSVSMPVRAASYQGAAVRNWFCNLLPEGAVRDAITRRLRLQARDDFGLLRAIGGECAGAVSVGEAPAHPADGERDLETLLRQHSDGVGEGGWALLGAPVRLSLAGAQDKIPVVLDPRIRLPAAGAPSSHILKPDSLRFPGICDYEAFGLALARQVGLDACAARMVDIAGRRALLVTRYDRVPVEGGGLQRIHQEDFCQALGLPPELKYQHEADQPSAGGIARVVRDQARLGPRGIAQMLDWAIFHVLVGNADAHAKNISLLHPGQANSRLAPIYDPAPTIAYPASMLDREPALRIGQARRIDEITGNDWALFAKQTGFQPRFVLRRVSELASSMVATIPAAIDAVVRDGADRERAARAGGIVTDHATQCARRL